MRFKTDCVCICYLRLKPIHLPFMHQVISCSVYDGAGGAGYDACMCVFVLSKWKIRMEANLKKEQTVLWMLELYWGHGYKGEDILSSRLMTHA